MVSNEYLNIQQAARYLSVSGIKIRNLISKGLLTVLRDPLDDRKRLVIVNELDSLKKPRPIDRLAIKRQLKKTINPVPGKKQPLKKINASS